MKQHFNPVAVLALALTILHFPTSASGQTGGPYDLSWSTIDGGGGSSSGGPYTLVGSIGQTDVGPAMVGGNYSLIGGFWSIVSAVQTLGAPRLTVSRDFGTGAVRVSWPEPAPGWVLDQSPMLNPVPAPLDWTQVGFPYQTNAGQISISIPSPAGNRFYRLRKP